LRAFQRAQQNGDLRPFLVERDQSALQGRNLPSDVVRVGDGAAPFIRGISLRKPSDVFIDGLFAALGVFTGVRPTVARERAL
jgi:hypothetical protein